MPSLEQVYASRYQPIRKRIRRKGIEVGKKGAKHKLSLHIVHANFWSCIEIHLSWNHRVNFIYWLLLVAELNENVPFHTLPNGPYVFTKLILQKKVHFLVYFGICFVRMLCSLSSTHQIHSSRAIWMVSVWWFHPHSHWSKSDTNKQYHEMNGWTKCTTHKINGQFTENRWHINDKD